MEEIAHNEISYSKDCFLEAILNMEQIKNLLHLVSITNEKNAEILDATGGRFNMFRICGANHYEKIHSAILAEFLNPKGSHGLKSKLLECFVKTLIELNGIRYSLDNFNCQNAQVCTEHSTDEGQIDIFITDNQNKAIIIENKVYAGDQWKQLKRYNKFAGDKYRKENLQILYLTLDGKEASKQSGKGVDYLPISYGDTIIKWLEKCGAIAIHFPIVRETINQYINHLKQLTNQDMDTKNQEEILQILIKPENLNATKIIWQNFHKIYEALAEKYFIPKMNEFVQKYNMTFKLEECSEKYIQFRIDKPAWKGKYWILFQPYGKGISAGLCNFLSNKISDKTYKEIKDKLNGQFDSADWGENWFPFRQFWNCLDFDKWKDEVMSGKYSENCIILIEDLLNAMKGLEEEL